MGVSFIGLVSFSGTLGIVSVYFIALSLLLSLKLFDDTDVDWFDIDY
jgi:hypothetical protein